MLRSTIHLPPIEEGEFFLCYVKKSSIVAIVWVIISLFSAVMIAYFGRMVMGAELLTQGNQKLVFIAMARRFFPAGICGLLLAAIIAASISTADLY